MTELVKSMFLMADRLHMLQPITSQSAQLHPQQNNITPLPNYLTNIQCLLEQTHVSINAHDDHCNYLYSHAGRVSETTTICYGNMPRRCETRCHVLENEILESQGHWQTNRKPSVCQINSVDRRLMASTAGGALPLRLLSGVPGSLVIRLA